MADEKKVKSASHKQDGQGSSDVPNLFRINVEVGNLNEAAQFYENLFGTIGRLQAGSRCYFTCGPVTLQVLDVSSQGPLHLAAKLLYFLVNNLDAIRTRKALNCLSKEEVHGKPGGQISVRPRGRAFLLCRDNGKIRSVSSRRERFIPGSSVLLGHADSLT